MGNLLSQDAKPIMERWFERATDEQLHTDPKEREEVMNDLLDMVKSIGVRLEDQSSAAFEDAAQVAREHGHQRASFGWNIVSLVKDYEILHGVLLEHFGEAWGQRLTYRQSAVLVAVLDGAIGKAVGAYHESVNRKMAEQVHEQRAALRQLTFDLTDAEHRERQQIAQTLHDDFQQILVATQMKLQACLQSSPPDLSAVEEASRLLTQLLQISRDVTADLHPAILEDQNLPAALQWLGETFEQRFNLKVTIELKVSPQCTAGPIALQRVIYDAVRELLFNVVKHGKTDQVRLKVCCDAEAPWNFEIEDRGAGFSDTENKAVPGGKTNLGLKNVRRRIGEIGGTIQVNSKPGQGTRIVLMIPLQLPT